MFGVQDVNSCDAEASHPLVVPFLDSERQIGSNTRVARRSEQKPSKHVGNTMRSGKRFQVML